MPAGFKAIILILFVAATVYLWGNARVQLWDRDEPRYAECSRQMLQSGDWVVPRLYDKLRFQKPPLIYWCQASAMRLLGSQGDAGAFAARLPSAVGVLLTLVMLAIAISRQAGVDRAKWTVFIFATSAMTIVSAKSCLTDGVLVLFITAAQLCFYRVWSGNRSWPTTILLAISLGMGILTKGPFIIGIVASTAAALGVFAAVGKWWPKRPAPISEPAGTTHTAQSDVPITPVLRYSEEPGLAEKEPGASEYLRTGVSRARGAEAHPVRTIAQFVLGILIISAIAIPWIVWVSHRAPDFLPAMLHEGKQHALEGKEGHHLPPGYHFVMVWAMFMPWSLFLPLAIGTAIRNLRVPEVRFALAAVLGPWIMVELMGTKLPHYFLPAYPALAYLVAFAIGRVLNGETAGVQSKPFFAGATVWAVAVTCVGALPWLAVRKFRPLPWDDMIAFSATGLIIGVGVFWLLRTRRFQPAFIAMGLGMVVTIGGASRLFAEAQYLRISTHIADTLNLIGATHPGDVKMVDYKEPSLGFYQGGTIREVEKKADLIYKPLNQWPHWIVITRDAWNMVPPATRDKLRVIDSCRGWAYADQGRVVEVMVVENSVY